MAEKDCVPKLKDLVYELKGVDWHELGVELEVPTHTLKNIGKENPTEARKLSEVLQYWLNNGEASWNRIVEALKRIDGHGKIIKTIESKYIPSVKPPEAKNSDDSTRLNERDHHTKLLSQLKVHAAKWRDIGTYLGFQQGELNTIQSNPMLLTQSPPQSYLNAMLSEWFQWAPGDGRGSKDFATLGALKNAVSLAGLGKLATELTIK